MTIELNDFDEAATLFSGIMNANISPENALLGIKNKRTENILQLLLNNHEMIGAIFSVDNSLMDLSRVNKLKEEDKEIEVVVSVQKMLNSGLMRISKHGEFMKIKHDNCLTFKDVFTCLELTHGQHRPEDF